MFYGNLKFKNLLKQNSLLFEYKTYCTFVALLGQYTATNTTTMDIKLTRKELGKRIAELRKLKGFSQEDVALHLKMSRPSLAQMELGNRSIDALELHDLSIILGFSLDDFMASDFVAKKATDKVADAVNEPSEERISVPTLQINKFKNVLLYMLERCAGKPNVGETVLYKLLYFSDFNHYEIYEEHLTGAQYRKLPYGPVPQQMDTIIHQMIENKQIQRVKTEFHGFPQTRYLPLEKADLTQLKASEKEVIDQVIEQMGNWTATTISEYSHKDLPWQVSEDGKDISYELAFYREFPYSVRLYDQNED